MTDEKSRPCANQTHSDFISSKILKISNLERDKKIHGIFFIIQVKITEDQESPKNATSLIRGPRATWYKQIFAAVG